MVGYYNGFWQIGQKFMAYLPMTLRHIVAQMIKMINPINFLKHHQTGHAPFTIMSNYNHVKLQSCQITIMSNKTSTIPHRHPAQFPYH